MGADDTSVQVPLGDRQSQHFGIHRHPRSDVKMVPLDILRYHTIVHVYPRADRAVIWTPRRLRVLTL